MQGAQINFSPIVRSRRNKQGTDMARRKNYTRVALSHEVQNLVIIFQQRFLGFLLLCNN